MPINVPEKLPAISILEEENIFLIDTNRSIHQDIRPLKIVILNLMPIKERTETQLLRILSNTPIQLEVTFIYSETHTSKNTTLEYLKNFYKTFSEIKNQKFDGLIITGAPVEHLKFEDVDYWQEIKDIMEWSKGNVTSTIHLCWAAQAGLYYHYGIEKKQSNKKIFGILKHNKNYQHSFLLRGIDDVFFAPHSRHTFNEKKDIIKNSNLRLLSESTNGQVYIVESNDMKNIFITGHPEYDKDTLKTEYDRDLKKGLKIDKPINYFNKDNSINMKWLSASSLIFSNWLNYYVYQKTPFKLD
jgi:homoserine O-succinyltransferase/O-acetyltransferase